MTLYIAAENIPAGCEVVVKPPSQYAYRLDRIASHPKITEGIVVGVATEGLREGFRIEAKGGAVREDDA
jgi:hypothetical protein